MRATTNCLRVLSLAAATMLATPAPASIVVTQVEDRAFFSMWLFSQHAQQNNAHNMILDNHDVTAVEVFNAETLAGADVCYISPTLDELQLTTAEIDALEAFVIAGGRLVIPADSTIWAEEFVELAARFDVIYGESFINGVIPATVQDTNNPIINGPAGMVKAFNGSSINDNLHSTNPDFRILATWDPGPVAVGYLELGEGEIVFLSDFNTWDNDLINMLNNEELWRNLFDVTVGDPAGLVNCSITFGSTDNEPCDIENLLDNDDVDQILRSQFGFTAFERNLVEIVINGNAGAATTMTSIETRDGSDTTLVVAKVKARNYVKNQLVDIAQYPVSFPSDDAGHSTPVFHEDFIHPEGDVQVAIRYVAPATFTPLGFTVGLDQVRVLVQ